MHIETRERAPQQLSNLQDLKSKPWKQFASLHKYGMLWVFIIIERGFKLDRKCFANACKMYVISSQNDNATTFFIRKLELDINSQKLKLTSLVTSILMRTSQVHPVNLPPRVLPA